MANGVESDGGLIGTILSLVVAGVLFVFGWGFRMQRSVDRHNDEINVLKDEYGVLATKEDVERVETAQIDRHAENTRTLEHITKRIDQIYLRRSDRREE